MEGAEYVSSCESEDGFPRLLRETLKWFNLSGYPEYHGKVFLDEGQWKWVVGVQLKADGAPERWWSTVIGNSFLDACHVAARDTLRILCSSYQGINPASPVKLFPPAEKNSLRWIQQLQALQQMRNADDPTVAYLALYLHTLDVEYDKLRFQYGKLEVRHKGIKALLTKTQQELQLLRTKKILRQVKREEESSSNPQCPSHIDEVQVAYRVATNPPVQADPSHQVNAHIREDRASMGAFLSLSFPEEGSSSQPAVQNQASNPQKLKAVLRE